VVGLTLVREFFWKEIDRNQQRWEGNRYTTRSISVLERTDIGIKVSNLIMKIHLHVVLEDIAPPTIGPRRSAKALTKEMFATNWAYFSGRTSSETMIVARDQQPPPPMP